MKPFSRKQPAKPREALRRLLYDPTSTISQAGQAALVLFHGTQGDFGSSYVSNITFPGLTTITVNSPSREVRGSRQ